MVMEAVPEDTGCESTMICSDHPYRNSTPGGGICAFCLQEKLGKLVSSASSFPTTAVFPSSSSSPSPSDFAGPPPAAASAPSSTAAASAAVRGRHHRIPFLTHRKKKKDPQEPDGVVFKRSKSAATPRRRLHSDEYSPRRRVFGFGFGSFLYQTKQARDRKIEKRCTDVCHVPPPVAAAREGKRREEEEGSPGRVGRRVSRSRSVGCGSRSFSGDFFERISTGFGDCTLRRVESHREGSKAKTSGAVRRAASGGQDTNGIIKERVKCGGIFGGFIIASSSSSSSSSSLWVSSSTEDNTKAAAHGRNRNWSWAFASPIRALSKPTNKREASNKTTPNLNAIPSLLAVRG